MTFAQENNKTEQVVCTYTVSGNTITFTPAAQYEIKRDADNNPTGLYYELDTNPLTYNFSFRGPELTLSNETGSVTLCAYNFKQDAKVIYISGDANYVYDAAAKFREDGLLTLAWSYTDEYGKEFRECRQFTAIVGGSDALILMDGENVYYYTKSNDLKLLDIVTQGMTDEDLLATQEMDKSALEALAQKRSDLFDALAYAFSEAGLSVQINKETGEIALDSTILFAVNESTVSDQGKELLSQFLQIYTSVVYSDTYNGFVSRILVEGHTDTTGAYESNQILSQVRADAVRAFCISQDSGVDPAYQQLLAASLSAVGYSWDYPIYAQDGSVDMDASRRVAFRFVINVES